MYVKHWRKKYYVPDNKETREELKFINKASIVSIALILLSIFFFFNGWTSLANSAPHGNEVKSFVEYGVKLSVIVIFVSAVSFGISIFLFTGNGETSRRKDFLKSCCYDVTDVPKDFRQNGKTFEELISRAEAEGIGRATCMMLLDSIEEAEKQAEQDRKNKVIADQQKVHAEEQRKLRALLSTIQIEESRKTEILSYFDKTKDYGEVTKMLMNILAKEG